MPISLVASGFQIVDISNPASPVLSGSLAITNARGVTVAGSYAYVTATVGTVGELKVVNIADPAHPVTVGSCTMDHAGGEVAVEGTRVYTSGMGIFDVSDPSAPYQYSWYHAYSGADLRVSNSIVYLVGAANIMEVVDASDPWNPGFVSFLDTYGNATAIALSGSRAYVADGTQALQVVNIADPARPSRTAMYDPPGTPGCIAISGTIAYTGDAETIVTRGLHIIDIHNFDAPTWVGERDTSHGQRYGHFRLVSLCSRRRLV